MTSYIDKLAALQGGITDTGAIFVAPKWEVLHRRATTTAEVADQEHMPEDRCWPGGRAMGLLQDHRGSRPVPECYVRD